MAETWLTYAELAERLGTTPEAARAKANRGRWRKQLDNTGKAKVLVDLDAQASRTSRTRSPARTPDHRPDAQVDAHPNVQAALTALAGHITTLQEQLNKAEALAAGRGQEIAVERERVADLTSRLLQLTADLMVIQQQAAADQRRRWWRRITG